MQALLLIAARLRARVKVPPKEDASVSGLETSEIYIPRHSLDNHEIACIRMLTSASFQRAGIILKHLEPMFDNHKKFQAQDEYGMVSTINLIALITIHNFWNRSSKQSSHRKVVISRNSPISTLPSGQDKMEAAVISSQRRHIYTPGPVSSNPHSPGEACNSLPQPASMPPCTVQDSIHPKHEQNQNGRASLIPTDFPP